MSWHFAIATDLGDRDQQQDRVTILHSEDGTAHLLVVADGMGGHQGGAKAAQTVIDVASHAFQQPDIHDPRHFLEKICLDAHRAIVQLAENRRSAPGSTCVLLYLLEDAAYWVHVGDSRLYQFRSNKFIFKTTDHSVAQLMQEQADASDTNAIPQNQLYMCLGGNNEVTPEPEVSKVQPDDFFLLCSDGLWNQLGVEEGLERTESVMLDQQYANQLVKIARQMGAGNSDNICLAWAQWQPPTEPKQVSLLERLSGFFSFSRQAVPKEQGKQDQSKLQ